MSSLLTESSNITLAEFLVESESFEYSDEYFDLMKEASEIELLERYLANQEYILECATLDSLEYMSESVKSKVKEFVKFDENKEKINGIRDDVGSKFNEVRGKLEEKSRSTWGRIKAGFSKIINAIVTFFSRLFNFWTNGKELDKLRNEAKVLNDRIDTMERNKDIEMDAVAKHIRKLNIGKEQAIKNLRKHISDKDLEISKLHRKFKGVDPELYRDLVRVESIIGETITVELPKTTSEIDNYTTELKTSIVSYQKIRSAGKMTNKATVLKHARVIATLLDKLRSSRNVIETVTISPAWLEEVHKSLSEDKDIIQTSLNDITGLLNDAHEGKNNINSSPRRDINAVRQSADRNFMELQRNLTMLLNEWILVANIAIKKLKEIKTERDHYLRVEQSILATIRQAVA